MIFCFTGTGNSGYVAEELSRLLGEQLYMLEHEALTGFGRRDFNDSRIIWVFPTYSWGVPPVMVGAIKASRCVNPGAVHFMVATCGDDAGLIARQWRRLMTAKGYHAAGAYTVIMPNNYTLMKGFDVDPQELMYRKIEDSAARIATIADAIRRSDCDDNVTSGKWAWFKSRVIYPWFIRNAMSPGPFRADHTACTRCGRCMDDCPCDNIAPGNDGYPQWSEHCALCLRCYHSCPHHAISYGKATADKGTYLLKRALKKHKK